MVLRRIQSDNKGDINCGICKTKCTQLNFDNFYCSACIHFKLLKYRLNLINLKKINFDNNRTINKILKLVFEDDVQFLKRYLNEKNKTSECRYLSDIDSIPAESIATLGFMLLNVEIIKWNKSLEEMNYIQNKKKLENEKLKEKINILKVQKVEKMRANLMMVNSRIDKLVTKSIPETSFKIENFRKLINIQQNYLRNNRLLTIIKILDKWNIHILDSDKLIILYSPILDILTLLTLNLDFIDKSLTQVINFVKSVTLVFDFPLPFEIDMKLLNSLTRNSSGFCMLGKNQILIFSVIIGKVILNILQLFKFLRIPLKYEYTVIELLRLDAFMIQLVDHFRCQYMNSSNIKKESANLAPAIKKCCWRNKSISKPDKEKSSKLPIKHCDFNKQMFYDYVLAENKLSSEYFSKNKIYKDVPDCDIMMTKIGVRELSEKIYGLLLGVSDTSLAPVKPGLGVSEWELL